MLRYPQIDKKIPLEDANFLADSFVNYFKGLEKIKNFYIKIQEDFLKSINITETEFLNLNKGKQENIKNQAKEFLKVRKNELYL